MDSHGKPADKVGLTSVAVTMPSMPDMGVTNPTITPASKPAHFILGLNFPHPGHYEMAFQVLDEHNESLSFTMPIDLGGVEGVPQAPERAMPNKRAHSGPRRSPRHSKHRAIRRKHRMRRRSPSHSHRT